MGLMPGEAFQAGAAKATERCGWPDPPAQCA